MKYEYFNHNNFIVKVPDRSGRLVVFNKKETKTITDDFLKRYVPRQLSLRKVTNDKPIVNFKPVEIKPKLMFSPNVQKKPIINPVRHENKPHLVIGHTTKVGKTVVGKQGHVGKRAAEFSSAKLLENDIAISNNIGIGILSYNRLGALTHLISSIRKFTDLSKTTVFVSDESTDPKVWEWLKDQKDIVPMHFGQRLGIACNTNRLLRCLDRFKFKLVLNDDVEILRNGWDKFYFDAMDRTNCKHFCYRQSGIYGAARPAPNSNGIITVQEKPHGAVMAIHDEAFRKVGFFDEEFGMYGMEHVDYSDRICKSGLTPSGYHDVAGSDLYFKIYNEESADNQKFRYLAPAKVRYESVKKDQHRIYIPTSDKTICPSISCVIPYRDTNRTACLMQVVDCIRAQRYPVIQIILVEQDQSKRIDTNNFSCVDYYFVGNRFNGMEFCKAMAFNYGVSKSKHDKIILHDADMIARIDYFKTISGLLDSNESVHVGATVCYMDEVATNKIISERSINRSNISSNRVVTYYEGGSLGILKSAYVRIGGFNEAFVGYGVEDCDFFWRLSATKLYNNRTIDLFHLWHGRSSGWNICHEKNKLIGKQSRDNGIGNEVAKLNKELLSRYKF